MFHTVNSNDIQFIAADHQSGLFRQCRQHAPARIGLSFGGKEGGLSWHLAYSFVDATFQSSFRGQRRIEQHRGCAIGNIRVQSRRSDSADPAAYRAAGARLRDQRPMGRRRQPGGGLGLVSSWQREQRQSRRRHQRRRGTSSRGSGWIPGYALINLQGTYHITKYARSLRPRRQPDEQAIRDGRFSHRQRIQSRRFAIRADPADWTNENAVSPGQPRAIWAGVRVRWGE